MSANTQRVRRIASPSTKQGPIKATMTFSLKQNSPTFSKSNNGRKTSPSSPPTPQRTSEPHWKTRKSPDNRSSPDRCSPNSPSLKEKFRPIRQSPVLSHQKRTGSLDTIAGPYLKGEWPRNTGLAAGDNQPTSDNSYVQTSQASSSLDCGFDKWTQTPEEWIDDLEKKIKSCHRRTASSGSTGRKSSPLIKSRLVKQSPTSSNKPTILGTSAPSLSAVKSSAHHMAQPSAVTVTVTPPTAHTVGSVVMPVSSGLGQSKAVAIPLMPRPVRVRGSVEGLNQEIEKLVLDNITTSQVEEKNGDVPDGHKAPVGHLLSGFVPSRSIDTQTPSNYFDLCEEAAFTFPAHNDRGGSGSSSDSPLSHSPSPCLPIMPGDLMDSSRPSSLTDSLDGREHILEGEEETKVPSSPGSSFFFVREPPDGCEKVKTMEDTGQIVVGNDDMSFCPIKPTQEKCLIPSELSAFCPLLSQSQHKTVQPAYIRSSDS